MKPAPRSERSWGFLTSHALVLLCLDEDPSMLQREIAERTALTERTVTSVIDDLVEGGFVHRTRVGRRNTYRVVGDQPLSPRRADDIEIGRLIAAVRPGERLDYQAVIELVADHVVDFLGDGCVMTMVGDDDEVLELLAVRHPDATVAASVAAFFTSVPQHIGDGISGRVASSGTPALIPEIASSDEFAGLTVVGAASMTTIDLTSLAVVPLIADGRTIGTIAAFRTGAGRVYTAADVELLAQFAVRAAEAIQRARHNRLGEAAEAHAALVELTSDALLVFAADGRCLAANPAACELFGRRASTMARLSAADLFDRLDGRIAPAGADSAAGHAHRPPRRRRHHRRGRHRDDGGERGR